MRTRSNPQKQLPVVRLSLAQPFLDAARRDLVDTDKVLAPMGINSQAFDNQDIFVPAPTMYAVVEALAEACSDPFIGAHLGLQLDPFQWPPLIQAARVSQSVGDFFLRFSIDAYRDASSVIFQLQTRGTRSSFRELRVMDGGILPRHNDAFGVAYTLDILKAAVGPAWEGHSVLAEVCDPTVLPDDFFGIRAATTDTRGFAISFPCDWLLLPPDLEESFSPRRASPTSTQSAPDSFLEALRHVLETKLGDQHLRAEDVAKQCGVSRRTLTRKLTEAGTTLNRELADLKRQQAQAYLANDNLSVGEISNRVGYNDSSVFTRAFRRWTGLTPSEYRASLKELPGELESRDE